MTGTTPLSAAQERLWLSAELNTESQREMTIWLPWSPDAPLSADQIEQIWRAVVARHAPLRSLLVAEQGTARMEVVPVERATEFGTVERVDVRTDPTVRDWPGVWAQTQALLPGGVDPQEGPWRAWVLERAQDRVLILALHHLVCDARSLEIIQHELERAARALGAGVAFEPPPLRLTYSEWVGLEAADGEARSQALEHFRTRLADAPPCHGIPTQFPRAAASGYRSGVEVTDLPPGLLERVGEVARAARVSPFHLLLAGYAAMLARLGGTPDMVVGVPTSGRTREGAEDLVGMFVNTVAVRLDASGDPTMGELATRVRDEMLAAWAAAGVPLQEVVRDLVTHRDPAIAPLYQLGFNFLDMDNVGRTSNGGAQEDLAVNLSRTQCRVNYDSTLFSADYARQYADRLLRVYQEWLAMPDPLAVRVADLSVLTPQEHHLVTETLATGEVRELPERTVLDLVADRVREAPRAEAVRSAGQVLDYAGLWHRSGVIAGALARSGVRPGERVAVCLSRGIDLIPGMLAVLRVGAGYVPLDPGYPVARLEFMLRDCGARVLLADGSGPSLPAAETIRVDRCVAPADSVGDSGGPVADSGGLVTDSGGPVSVVGEPASVVGEPGHLATPDGLAYLIYSSGSTGVPKGVPTRHDALLNRLLWMAREHQIGPEDVLVQKTPVSFDVSVWELFLPLLVGATIVVPEPDIHRDPRALRELFAAERVTVAHFVPSMLAEFVRDLGASSMSASSLSALRQLVCSGEALPAPLLRTTMAVLPWVRVDNLYGPTEAAVDVSWWRGDPHAECPGDRVPIGRPIDNVRLYVLDSYREPVLPGVPGHLHIGGVAVSAGYHNRPELTAERFVDTRWGTLYDTGDLASWRADGALDYLGRTDHQVKIRGPRIVLGEVVVALREHPGVRDAGVLARSVPTQHDEDDTRLVAYIVGQCDLVGLGERLPAHLVPAHVVPMERLPLTANGKLDRAALPNPTAPGVTSLHRGDPPESATEIAVADVFADVLGLDRRPDRHEDFFGLGGHSLTGTRVLARIEQRSGIRLTLQALFDAPTVAGLAALLAQATPQPSGPGLTRRSDPQSAVPLTPGQERIWFLHSMDPTDISFTVPIVRRIEGEIDRAALQAALDDVMARHPALRVTVRETGDGGPTQQLDPDARAVLEVHAAAGAEEAQEWVDDLLRRPFDLSAAPLVRAGLAQWGNGEALLCLTLHHIISDGISMNILMDDLGTAYTHHRGLGPELAPVDPETPDVLDVAAARAMGGQSALGVEYWQSELRDPEVLHLPTDHPRPHVRNSVGALAPFRLDAAATDALDRLAADRRCTPFVVVLACYQAFLASRGGTKDVCVGTPVAGRDDVTTEAMVGYFLNTVVLRGRLRADQTLDDLLADTRRASLAAMTHQDVPFETLLADLGVPRDPARTPVFQAMLTMQSQGTEAPHGFAELDLHPVTDAVAQARCDLTLESWRQDGGITGHLVYPVDLFEAATVERWSSALSQLVVDWVSHPERTLAEVSHEEVDSAWRRGPKQAGTEAVLTDLIARAAHNPAAAAVLTPLQSVSRADLLGRVNDLACDLAAAGVGPGDMVGLTVPRSVDSVVAMLATWAAGAGYVYLDPATPARRRELMVRDTGVRVLVGTGYVAGIEAVLPVPEVATARTELDPRLPGTDPDLVAYVIFTSGSSGAPKGVVVQHSAVAARVAWMREGYGITGDDRVLHAAALGFDTHVEEIYPTLASGATLVLSDDARVPVPDFLVTELGRTVTVLDLPTPYWHELVALQHPVWPPPLRLLILGADQVRGQALARWWETAPAGVAVANSYGPTETTVIATVADLRPQPDEPVGRPPIGRPIGDTVVDVRTVFGAGAGIGTPGELWVGGGGVSRGYLDPASPSAERFVVDDRLDGRCYRTGDLVRWRPDGQLEFLGRVDDQVKIRGYRVEPGEIEFTIAQCDGVDQVVVLPRGAEGETSLTAYVVGAVDGQHVRAHLTNRLPGYLVPDHVVVLPALPLTSTGKLDRAALPEPGPVTGGGSGVPETDAELLLARVWSEVLELERVGVQDDFFAVGGHSLLATRMVARLSVDTGIRLPLQVVFDNPRLGDLALAVEEALIAELETITDDEAAALLSERGHG